MKSQLEKMYAASAITDNGVLAAYSKGWITLDDAIEIIGADDAIEIVRAAKLKEMSDRCNAVIISGVDLELAGEVVHFNLTIEDQSNINNLFRVVELGGTEFPYQSDGGICRIYTAQEIAQIYFAAQTLITYQTTYHNALKAYIQTLTTIEEISGITYGITLPEPFVSEMNNKLAAAQAQIVQIQQLLLPTNNEVN